MRCLIDAILFRRKRVELDDAHIHEEVGILSFRAGAKNFFLSLKVLQKFLRWNWPVNTHQALTQIWRRSDRSSSRHDITGDKREGRKHMKKQKTRNFSYQSDEIFALLVAFATLARFPHWLNGAPLEIINELIGKFSLVSSTQQRSGDNHSTEKKSWFAPIRCNNVNNSWCAAETSCIKLTQLESEFLISFLTHSVCFLSFLCLSTDSFAFQIRVKAERDGKKVRKNNNKTCLVLKQVII